MFTYFEVERDYIGRELCVNKADSITICYGTCFLDQHVFDQDADRDVPLKRAEEPDLVFVFLTSTGITLNRFEFYRVTYHRYNEKRPLQSLSKKFFQPPELA